MTDLIILRNHRTARWDVFVTGEFGRWVGAFPTLLAAENYITRGVRPAEVES